MNRYRGTAVLLVTLFTLVLLGVALYALTPKRDTGAVETQVLHEMAAALDGLLQRCGLRQDAALEAFQDTPWRWVAALGAACILALGFRHGLRR